MRLATTAAVSLVLILTTGGCHCFQAIEQWKCNHLGMCGFAKQPTNGLVYPYGASPYPQTYAPLPASSFPTGASASSPPAAVSPSPMMASPPVPAPYTPSLTMPTGSPTSSWGYTTSPVTDPTGKQPCTQPSYPGSGQCRQ